MAKTDTKKTDDKGKPSNWFERTGLWESSGKKDVGTTTEVPTTNEDTDNTGSVKSVFNFSEMLSEEATTTPVITPVVKSQAPSPTSEIDPKIAEQLKKVLIEANFPGPDYFEFKQQLDNLAEVITDEPTRYKAAYKSLPGITKEKITDSAQKYIGILVSENGKFSEAISQKSGTDIDFKTQEAKVLNAENINLQKQIEELKAKILTNTQKINVLGIEVQKTQDDIANKKKKFENTLNGFVTEIKSNSQKAVSYIQQ